MIGYWVDRAQAFWGESVIAILAIRGTMQGNMTQLFQAAADKTSEAAGALGGIKTEKP